MQMRAIFWSLSCLLLAGCATSGGWQPTVDPRISKSDTLSRDLAECKQLAQEVSGDPAKKAGIGALAGGALGAAAGAVLGAASGNAGSGAAIGTAVGGLGGAATQGLGADEQYKRAYIKCLEGRGQRVLNS